MADGRISDFGVINFLFRIIDRLVVNALAGFGVVLDFDGDIAADAFDKNTVLDGYVRMIAIAEGFAIRSFPSERVRGREADFAKLRSAAAIRIPELPAVENPLENGNV